MSTPPHCPLLDPLWLLYFNEPMYPRFGDGVKTVSVVLSLSSLLKTTSDPLFVSALKNKKNSSTILVSYSALEKLGKKGEAEVQEFVRRIQYKPVVCMDMLGVAVDLARERVVGKEGGGKTRIKVRLSSGRARVEGGAGAARCKCLFPL